MNLPFSLRECLDLRLSIRSHQHVKLDGEIFGRLPEILSGNSNVKSDERNRAIWQDCLSRLEKSGMPETEDQSRRQINLPIGMCGNDLMHECKQVMRVVLQLDIDVKKHMSVFGLELRINFEG